MNHKEWIPTTKNKKKKEHIRVLSEQHGAVISHGDIELGEVPTPPRPLPLPLARPSIRRPQRTKERHQEVLVQRVPHEPDPPAPHEAQEGVGIDARNSISSAAIGVPGPRVDRPHALPPVPEAVPRVPVEGAGPIVEGSSRTQGIAGPSAGGEVGGAAATRGRRRAARVCGVRGGGVGEEEGGGIEEGKAYGEDGENGRREAGPGRWGVRVPLVSHFTAVGVWEPGVTQTRKVPGLVK